jgi:hypothetical protein
LSQAEKLIEFLAALIKDAGKTVFLILDNLRVHHSKIVKAWVAERKDQIELFYLPSYTGQLPPLVDYGKPSSERLLYPGTCPKANSHNSALCKAFHKAEQHAVFSAPWPAGLSS